MKLPARSRPAQYENIIRRYAETQVPRYTSYPTAADFSKEIGSRQYEHWLSRFATSEQVSLYIHVPYCRALCRYCGCHAKLVSRDEIIASYAQLLKTEIALVGRHMGAAPIAARLHWGGGTPAVLDPAAMTSVVAALSDVFPFDHSMEQCD